MRMGRLVAGLGLLLVVAAGASTPLLRSGTGRGGGVALPAGVGWVAAGGVLLAGLAFAVAHWQAHGPGRRGGGDLIRLVLAIVAVGWLLILLRGRPLTALRRLFAFTFSPVHRRTQTTGRGGRLLPHTPHAPVGSHPEVGWVLVASAVLLAILVSALLRRRERPEPAVATGVDADSLAGALGDTLAELRAHPDPRLGVIAAYATMTRRLAEVGLGRQPAEAPLEFLGRVLAAHGADPAPLRELTGLFEEARFSRHPVPETARQRALGALAAMRTALAPTGAPAMAGEHA